MLQWLICHLQLFIICQPQFLLVPMYIRQVNENMWESTIGNMCYWPIVIQLMNWFERKSTGGCIFVGFHISRRCQESQTEGPMPCTVDTVLHFGTYHWHTIGEPSLTWTWVLFSLDDPYNELPGLVNEQFAMENQHFSWENPLFLWPFSIAMLVHQRVVVMICFFWGFRLEIPCNSWTTFPSLDNAGPTDGWATGEPSGAHWFAPVAGTRATFGRCQCDMPGERRTSTESDAKITWSACLSAWTRTVLLYL